MDERRLDDVLYQQLAEPFPETHELPKAGGIEYLATEQVVSRLTRVLGVDGWEFRVRRDGRDDQTVWCVGALRAHFPSRTVTREQYGECKIEAGGRGMDVGDARKGAASDALKKCATLIGVGLYLTEKEVPHQVRQAQAQQAAAPPQKHPNGLWVAACDPLTESRKQAFLAEIKKYGADEQDFIFSAGRPVEEWCAQNQTGYAGAAQAYTWFKQEKSRQMIGSERPRAGVGF